MGEKKVRSLFLCSLETNTSADGVTHAGLMIVDIA